jgi:hypothetical protein
MTAAMVVCWLGGVLVGVGIALFVGSSDRARTRSELVAVQLERQSLDLDERRRHLAEQGALRAAYLESLTPAQRADAARMLSTGWRSIGREPPPLVSRQRQQAEARRWGWIP